MLFGVLNGVGQVMGVLDGVLIIKLKGEGALLGGEFGTSHCNQ